MIKNQSKGITVKDIQVNFFLNDNKDFVSLTDIAKFKNADDPRYVIQNWMKTYSRIEFLGLWESINNKNFNRVEFDSFKNLAGSNAFVMTPRKWVESTNAIGIISKAGRYGGTYAHKDIAFEFASWISAEFKLYLIKEFQRLKEDETKRLQSGWDAKRALTKINYRIHTDAIKKHIVPKLLTKKQKNHIYANEADVLNVALYGMTAKEWRDKNKDKSGNIRDYSDVRQLICLANLESINAEFIRQEVKQLERLNTLNEIAIIQMESLTKSDKIKKLN